MRTYLLVAGALAGLVQARTALAALADWNLPPYTAEWGDWSILLGGQGSAASYDANMGGTGTQPGITGSALLQSRIGWEAENGWQLELHATALIRHDALSGDIYGNRFIEQAYATLQTQYGRLAIGREDGAAFDLAQSGPKVDASVSLDAPQTTFFRNPLTGESVFHTFPLVTAEFASTNATKLSYNSPSLFGLEFGASFAPSLAGAGDQRDVFEAALDYERNFDRAVFEAYLGTVDAAAKQLSGSQLRDFGTGVSIDYDFDALSLEIGGGYRRSNDYAFDAAEVAPDARSTAIHLGLRVTTGPWVAGWEYVDGATDAIPGRNAVKEEGFQPSASYTVNSNAEVGVGWQHVRFEPRDNDYTVRKAPPFEAAYMHVVFHV